MDEKHIWYNGKQFIRLDRFIELQTDQLNEIEILNEQLEKLHAENNALRLLLEKKGE